ncbi:MAG: hybrid sensor histidine kinase/response regulator [Planctomycetota bacterium]
MTEERLTILAVDDDHGDAELLRRNLAQIPGIDLDFVHVPTVVEAEAALSRVGVDLTFVDYRLGSGTGLDLLRSIRASGDLRPVICLTGQGDEHVATNMLQAGADDYLVKSELTPETLRHSIETSTAHYHQRRLEEQNRRLLKELQTKHEMLEKNSRHLAEMYDTAHQLIDDVSHEFRTPLTVIQEFTSILRDGLAGEISAERGEYLGIVLNRVDDLSALVDDMSDINKLEAGLLGVRRTVCRVADILEPIRTTLERKAALRKTTLDIDLARHLPAVYCDPEKIGRVIINLTVNAFKFSEDHGEVRLSASHDRAEAQVVFAVTDHGAGIHPDSVEALFERFTQIGTVALGLGLNVAKELVRLNLGDISVESRVGQGSTFSFTVPTAEPARLIMRCLKRVAAFREDTAFAALVSARVTATLHGEARDEVEQFIQQHVRRSDLVFHTRPNVWLLVLTSRRRDVDVALRRIHDAWAEENRNRPVALLPAIEFDTRGTWALADGTKEFIERFEMEYGPAETSDAGIAARAAGEPG